jgi:hypothetical protein
MPIQKTANRFCCVDDGVPDTTISLLKKACESRDVSFHHIDAPEFDYQEERVLGPGDLLYRPAVSMAALAVEQFLWSPGVATFYARLGGVFFAPTAGPLQHQRAGLPVPRTFPVATSDRTMLASFVTRLGGYPVVLKMSGFSSGIGVMRVDSAPALLSLVDWAMAEGKFPHLCAYVPDAVHWRVTVVGNKALAAYRNQQEPDDFRTSSGEDPKDFTTDVPQALAELAVKSCISLEQELGGVDILEHPSGRLYLLESNFPCYFGTAQEVIGVDIAGAMIDHLLGKAQSLRALPG